MNPFVQLQLSAVVRGKTWNLYDAEFQSKDGVFCFYFYATSDEHASEVIKELKATAKLGSQILGAEPE